MQQPTSGEEFVEHEIYNHAGDRHVHPDWVRPARDPPMAFESILQAEREGDQDHWDHNSGQNRMRDQDREINGPRPSAATKPNRSNMQVVIEITGQEQRRAHEGGNHGCAMLENLATLDEAMSYGEQHRGQAIKGGVDRRKDAVVGLQVKLQAASFCG